MPCRSDILDELLNIDHLNFKEILAEDSSLECHLTLPTKIHLVKAMVFPVVTYGCESWTVKKAEH